MSEHVAFHKLANDLQQLLGSFPEVLQNPGGERYFGYLVKKLHALKIKMYQEPGHALPHIHIDHGRGDNHGASYSIDPVERLVGYLDAKSEYIVINWLAANREALLSAWYSLQHGTPDYVLFAELKAGT